MRSLPLSAYYGNNVSQEVGVSPESYPKAPGVPQEPPPADVLVNLVSQEYSWGSPGSILGSPWDDFQTGGEIGFPSSAPGSSNQMSEVHQVSTGFPLGATKTILGSPPNNPLHGVPQNLSGAPGSPLGSHVSGVAPQEFSTEVLSDSKPLCDTSEFLSLDRLLDGEHPEAVPDALVHAPVPPQLDV